MKNKGRQDYTILTVNGRVRLWRRRWHSSAQGTITPLDSWVDLAEASISLGVREMACRLNGDGKNFDKAADNLARVTPTPITATVFEDKVAAGMRYIYAVEAVDRAGNVSLMSNTIEDAAR